MNTSQKIQKDDAFGDFPNSTDRSGPLADSAYRRIANEQLVMDDVSTRQVGVKYHAELGLNGANLSNVAAIRLAIGKMAVHEPEQFTAFWNEVVTQSGIAMG